jgi:pseudouridine synthase
VNGKLVQDPELWIDINRDKVFLDGKPLRSAAKQHILLYKPTGYITTYRDPEGRPTVYDLISDAGVWLTPVGRLDLETSGLLIMTNDTDLAEHITNPDHKVSKTYQVKAAGLLTEDQVRQLSLGVVLSDGPTKRADVRLLRQGANSTHLEITISEGRNRQVRRMLEAVGSKVLKLVRTAIGPIRIGNLQIGKWRPLTEDELRSLRG